MPARGRRLTDPRAGGLVLEDAESKRGTGLHVRAVETPEHNERYDLVLVLVRSEQLGHAAGVDEHGRRARRPVLRQHHGPQRHADEAFADRALFGFPAAGGRREGSVVRYALIRQQRTMLREANGSHSPQLRELKRRSATPSFQSGSQETSTSS